MNAITDTNRMAERADLVTACASARDTARAAYRDAKTNDDWFAAWDAARKWTGLEERLRDFDGHMSPPQSDGYQPSIDAFNLTFKNLMAFVESEPNTPEKRRQLAALERFGPIPF